MIQLLFVLHDLLGLFAELLLCGANPLLNCRNLESPLLVLLLQLLHFPCQLLDLGLYPLTETYAPWLWLVPYKTAIKYYTKSHKYRTYPSSLALLFQIIELVLIYPCFFINPLLSSF